MTYNLDWMGTKENIIRKQFCAQRIDDDPQATWDGIGWIHESDECEKTASMIIHLLVRKYQHNAVYVRRS